MSTANISNSVLHSERKPQLSKSIVEKEHHNKPLATKSLHEEAPAKSSETHAEVDHKVSALAAAEIAAMKAEGGGEEFPDAVLFNEDHGHLRSAHVAAHVRPLSNPLAGGRGPRRASQVTSK